MPNLNKLITYYLVSSKSSTKSVILKGFFAKEDYFTISDVTKSAAFAVDELAKSTLQQTFKVVETALVTGEYVGMQPFNFVQGGEYAEDDLIAWAVENGYTMQKDGTDVTGPLLVGITLNAGKTVVTFTFDKLVNNNLAGNTELKAATTVATSGGVGGTFGALGGSDSVSTPNGAGATYAVTFNGALTGTGNAIKIAAGALKDATGNTNEEICVPIDITVPTVTFYPAHSATNVVVTLKAITIGFDEPLYTVSTHLPTVDADLVNTKILFKLTDVNGANVACTVTISANKKCIMIEPTAAMTAGTTYAVAIAASSFEDSNRNAVAAAHAYWGTAS